jgi:hypothetical protein
MTKWDTYGATVPLTGNAIMTAETLGSDNFFAPNIPENQISTIPAELGLCMANLKYLYLSSYKFTGAPSLLLQNRLVFLSQS